MEKTSFRYLHEKKVPHWKVTILLAFDKIKRTYILYNIVNSYLVWKEHPCFSNIAALNSRSCFWAHCQLHCTHIRTDFSFWVEHFFTVILSFHVFLPNGCLLPVIIYRIKELVTKLLGGAIPDLLTWFFWLGIKNDPVFTYL